MSIRRASLPPGWYPRDAASVRSAVESWKSPSFGKGAKAAIAPHAGWTFSGRIASIAWSALGEAETVAIVGGHLPSSSPILFAPENGFESPFGTIAADLELRDRLLDLLAGLSLPTAGDRAPDNTVEVHLPFMGLFAAGARVLWLRAPASGAAIELGKAIHEAATSLGRKVVVLGSTDLTHYGPDYGFEPKGRGSAAERWVREVNDRKFLDALIALDPTSAISFAVEEGSACSPGAAAAALAFALAEGAGTFAELAYGTSLDVRPASSFVGYAALASSRDPLTGGPESR